MLSEIYYDPKHPAGLGSLDALASAAGVSKKRVEAWSRAQPTYTLHRQARKRYPTRAYIVSNVDDQWQVDLADMVQVARHNRGYHYILTVIDIMSRYAWARPLKSKRGTEVAAAFRSIFREGRIPKRVQSDQGKEFENAQVRALFAQHDIELFSVKSQFKCSLVERYNRTLKTRIWRYFTAQNTKTWIRVLPDLVHSYNHRVHRTIRMRPVDVTPQNAMALWHRLHGRRRAGAVPRDIQVGDRVRISKVKSVFDKGYLPNWTDEEFFVDSINTKYAPTMFTLRDAAGEVIDGSFYRHEIQPIARADEVYLVERILRRQRRRGEMWYFVKWRGYPTSMNSWVRRRDMERVDGTRRRY